MIKFTSLFPIHILIFAGQQINATKDWMEEFKEVGNSKLKKSEQITANNWFNMEFEEIHKKIDN